ncbi:PREDICTED: LOW QUALITY PROTEIN: uncharacterized protein LOC109467300 [Branchiostoma belcheri]|uniref:LOW QUALITY PROTEIN: uncharacterized protein LOC109467300 n=1 Tax=Branchiostoma belcheri TaxID=7741 RepID=A0A6P4Y8L6_BRABE|nr:PREDICTED: LOW QUALITY PROTEIN: uncharacterized protein LOC109467300 [Branchiostoma belcheri]
MSVRRAKTKAVILFLLLSDAACAASSGPRFPQCKAAEWQECVSSFTYMTFHTAGTNACVMCEVLSGSTSVATSSPFRFLARGANGVAIRGYPFHVLSALTLAPLKKAKVYTLALIDAKIADVKNNTFAGFTGLMKLSLNSNRLTHVKQAWFTGLEKLSLLMLSNNNIRQIEAGSFRRLTRLHLLDMHNNLLKVVDPSWLFGLEGMRYLDLRSNAINSVSPGSFQQLQLARLDLRDNDLSCLDGEVLWGQTMLSQLYVSSGMLSSVHGATPHGMTWGLHRLASLKRGSVTMTVAVPKFHFCVRQNPYSELSFGWMFVSSDNVTGNTEFGALIPGRSCGDLDSSLSTISIQPPVVVLATDVSLTDTLDIKTLEQCRQVWEYDGGIAVSLVQNSIFRLVSMATESTVSEGVAMSFVQTQDTSSLTTIESGSSQQHTTHTDIAHDKTKNVTCILLTRGEHTEGFFTVPLVQRNTHTTETLVLLGTYTTEITYRTGTDHSSSPSHYFESTEKDNTTSDQSTHGVSPTPGPDLEVVQTPGHVLIPVVVSVVAVLVLSSLAVLLWKVRTAKLNAEDDRDSDDAHVWTIPPGVTFPGLLRSASLPTACSGKMASDDAVSCRSLPAVLHSIEPTYSVIPDNVASAQRPLPGLPHVYSEIPDDVISGVVLPASLPACTRGGGPEKAASCRSLPADLPSIEPTYSQIPDDEDSGPMSFYADAGEISLHVTDGQRNPFYRNTAEVEGIRSRRQQRTALVSQPAEGVRRYVNVTDAILSRDEDVTRAHIAFLTQPTCNTYWSWEIQGEGNLVTPRRVSLPTVTLPNTYWPWELPGEGASFTRRRVSLPTVTLPNTYWPWELPGEGTQNTAQRSYINLTLPNTYWPWELPGDGTSFTRRPVSLPTVTLPNTYWPWELPGEGTHTSQRSSIYLTLPTNTYWPWEIPGRELTSLNH